jgi:hypothetical protein
MTVTKLTEVHIHDASNYAREALEDTGRKISTNVRPGWFDITARKRGTLFADGVSVVTNGDAFVDVRRLEGAVRLLREKIMEVQDLIGDGITDDTPALRQALRVVAPGEAVSITQDELRALKKLVQA